MFVLQVQRLRRRTWSSILFSSSSRRQGVELGATQAVSTWSVTLALGRLPKRLFLGIGKRAQLAALLWLFTGVAVGAVTTVMWLHGVRWW